MRIYNYKDNCESLLNLEIVSLLTQIHEYNGKQTQQIANNPNAMAPLLDIARIQSVKSSNAIEGIYTSDDRIKRLALAKANPLNNAEEEIAGYRDVLNTIHLHYDNIDIRSGIILQLHRDLNKYNTFSFSGKYKNSDNVIAEEDENGNRTIRFKPLEAWAVSDAMTEICSAYNEAITKNHIDPLLVIPMFILDFLCIHPFNDGNGRISRLLTLLLLYRCGYLAGKYISIERIIEDTKEQYYDALQKSSFGWHENENDYLPFVRYMLGVFYSAHKEFDAEAKMISESKLSKPERVAKVIEEKLGTITKQEVKEKCPGISETTIQRTLNDLLKANRIRKISGGRYTSYCWNTEVR